VTVFLNQERDLLKFAFSSISFNPGMAAHPTGLLCLINMGYGIKHIDKRLKYCGTFTKNHIWSICRVCSRGQRLALPRAAHQFNGKHKVMAGNLAFMKGIS
jgi:hypothetical protein